MADQENIDSLKKRLEGVPDLTDRERDILTSTTLLTKIMPLMSAFVTENVTQVQKVKDKTGESMAALAKSLLESPGDLPDIQNFVGQIWEGNYDGRWVNELIKKLAGHWLAGPLLSLVVAALHTGTSAYGFLSVSAEKTRQTANELIKPYILDLGSLVEEYFRHPNNYAFVLDQMRKTGIDDNKIGVFLDNQTNLLPLDMLRILWNREEISDDDFSESLRKQRFNPDDFDLIKTAMKQYPSMSDFVLFSVREAYDDQFVQDAGLGQDMPNEFVEDAKKAGFAEDYIPKYWYSHWVPPSAGQAYTMLHRGLIDEEELNTLLRINDIMPNYREKMMKIAYNTVGRVDIRRFYQDGVVEYEKMYELYLASGQSPENAELMSEWTELHYGEDRRQRTRTDILKLYKLGTYSRQQAIDGVADIGYSLDISEEFVDRVDLEALEKRKANKLKIWRKGFINYVFDEQQVRKFMTDLGVKKREADDNVDEWKVDRDSKIRFLALKDIEKMFMANIMNKDEVEEELSIQGYSQIDSQRLIQLWSKPGG